MSIGEKLTIIAENMQKVYDAGVKTGYDKFWDDFQQNGNRTDYRSALGGFNVESFKPKYPIRPTDAYFMFYNSGGGNLKIKDFVEYAKENNIVLDYSRCTNAYYGVGCLRSQHFGVLDFSVCENMQSLFYGHQFNSTDSVVTIDEFISSEITTYNANTFQHATQLTNLTMKGVIAKNSFNVSYCTKLTHDSLMSIINCLKDFSGSGTTYTVTLGTANLVKLSDSEKAIATEKGWTLA